MTHPWRSLLAGAGMLLAAGAFAQGNAPTVTVAIRAPAAGTVLSAPANIALSASASINRDNWAILRVEFYSGTQLLGTSTSPPYTLQWSNVAAGDYVLRARAIATNPGQAKQDAAAHPNMPTWEGISAPVAIRVDVPPTVSITSPANNSVFAAPASITLAATAADADGTVTKVEFFDGATLIGTASAAPYTVTVTNAALGAHSFTAKATDNQGIATTSAALAVTVDAPPTVSLTSPATNAVFNAPANVALTATASDTDGTVAKVAFYRGTTLVGSASASPYTATVSNLAAGSYSFTAVATDDRGISTTSAAVSIWVDAPPTVSITSPANNALVIAPATITLTASAADADGTIAKVDFYQGATLVGTATASPYTATLSNLAAGNYSFTAVATDNDGGQATSAAVSVTVDAPPTVAITSPAIGTSFNAPASVVITASASDADGTITRVELYANATLIATLTAAPYRFNWTNVAAGTYTLSAKAVDNNNAEAMSAAVSITVTAQRFTNTLYFIHVDHLNTPRLVADANQQTVWQWDQVEPFGNNPADENPSGPTSFDLPLRLPGQYFDRETGLAYNVMRDYDAGLGRYTESDPIGLAVGLNTYLYVRAASLRYTDPMGLAEGCGPDGDWKERFVPNNPFGYPFKSCCDAHDACYGNCKGPDQLGCDGDGCKCFFDKCKTSTGYSQALCRRLAQEYCYRITYSETATEQFNKARARCKSCTAK